MMEEVVINTREILRWLRFQNIPALKKMLEEILTNPEEKWVYNLADGHSSQRRLSSETDVAQTTISGWLRSWHQIGLLDKIDEKYKKIESLENLGIKVPKLKKKSKPTETKGE